MAAWRFREARACAPSFRRAASSFNESRSSCSTSLFVQLIIISEATNTSVLRQPLTVSFREIEERGFCRDSPTFRISFIHPIRAKAAAASPCTQMRLRPVSQNLSLICLHSALAQVDLACGQIDTQANLVILSIQVATPMPIANLSLTDAFSSRSSRIHQSPSPASRVSYPPCFSTCRSSSAPTPGPNGSR